MNVYIVCVGYDYEGFDIAGVYATRELAETKVVELEAARQYDSVFIETCLVIE